MFEEAIVPRWREGRLRLGKVYVSRRPQLEDGSVEGTLRSGLVQGPGEVFGPVEMTEEQKEEHNYTMFDLNIDEVEVTLSLPRWLDGKGLVENAKVKGVRGVIGQHSRSYFVSRIVRITCYHRNDQIVDTFFGTSRSNCCQKISDTKVDLETLKWRISK